MKKNVKRGIPQKTNEKQRKRTFLEDHWPAP
jgi:hypothetical protein